MVRGPLCPGTRDECIAISHVTEILMRGARAAEWAARQAKLSQNRNEPELLRIVIGSGGSSVIGGVGGGAGGAGGDVSSGCCGSDSRRGKEWNVAEKKLS